MSTEKKALSSLSSLARQNSNDSTTYQSLSQLKQKSQAQATIKNLSPLQNLAQKNTVKPNSNGLPSLTSLAQRSTPKTTSLSHLSSRSLNTTSSTTSLARLSNLAQPSVKPKEETREKETKQTNEIAKRIKNDVENENSEDNPLCAKPSAAARFLFEKPPETNLDRHIQFSETSLHTLFYESIKKSSPIPVFAFDKPSPDDTVFAAQNQRGINKKN